MPLTPSQIEQFRQDGFIIVPDVFDGDKMDTARLAMDQILYGKPW
jgi:hypothetical protein